MCKQTLTLINTPDTKSRKHSERIPQTQLNSSQHWLGCEPVGQLFEVLMFVLDIPKIYFYIKVIWFNKEHGGASSQLVLAICLALGFVSK